MGDHAEASKDRNLITRLFTACTHLFQRFEQNTAVQKLPKLHRKEQTRNQAAQDKMQSQGTPQQPVRSLYEIIDDGSFYTLPDLEVLQSIKADFPQELERLKRATFVRNSKVPQPKQPSIADSLYGQDYAEINRTLVGVLALRWLHKNDYETFVGTQSPAPIVLKRESFDWLRSLFDKGLKSTEDTYTLITSMVTNDLGKDPNLAKDYAVKEGIDISKVNHDMILYHAVDAGMVPALDRLTQTDRDYLLLGIKLGSDFNFGQLAQAENAPASLSGLLEMRGHDRAFEMRFMEQVLDLAGAAGHEDWTCARKMIEPIFQSYKNVYDVAQGIILRHMSLREGYDIILTRKLDLLHSAGYTRHFDVQNPADRAIMRLFCLGNTSDATSADIFYTAFTEGLAPAARDQLVHGLNVDGSVDEPAVQPTYIPAMLTKALANTGRGTHEEKVAAATAMLQYLARCMVVEPASLQSLPKGVTVIERDVRILIPVLDGEAFKLDPAAALRDAALPEDQVANMAASLEH